MTRKTPRFARAAGMISVLTMVSRLLGLAREQLFAALMGASAFADAFIVAFRIPNLLRDLFAEGALAQAFVPTFKGELKRAGTDRAYQLANRIAGNLMVIIGGIVLLALVFAPQLVDAIAGAYKATGDKFELTVLLTRIMLPFLLIISLAAVAMGMLNAQDRYAPPAAAPALFNVVSIVVGLVLWRAGISGRAVVIGWSVGTLLGGMAQLGVQIPALWRAGYRARLALDLGFRDPGVRRIARLMGPAIVGLAAVQVNVFVNTLFASSEPGAVAWLNYAFRFLQLPIGVFGVAIAVVSTTRFSDAAADSNRAAMADQLVQGLRLVLFLTVPATVGLFLLGQPIIQLIYQRGEFHTYDTVATAAALRLYIVGLVAYASVKVCAPAFYAVDRARWPMAASVLAVTANVTLNVTLHPIYGYRVLALGTALAATLNFAVLYVGFGLAVHRVRHAELFGQLVRVGLAAGVMGAAVFGTHHAVLEAVGNETLADRAAVALVPVLVGVGVYGGAAHVLHIPELRKLLRR